ncbi:MAG TPA: DoxX family protein [Chlamydiales bacterium]|nr:DoxX family protein [Chlamydiales bacterium]
MDLTNPFLHRMELFYGFFIKIGSNLQSLFLLYMRLTWGHQFLLAGTTKLGNIDPVIQFFTSLNFVHPDILAYLIGTTEAVCGTLLILGFASRIAAIPLIITMLIALFTAHASKLANFQFILNPHTLVQEQPYPYLITAILVFIFGPGRVSLDAWIKRWVQKQPRY